jgi:hypothetical protein
VFSNLLSAVFGWLASAGPARRKGKRIGMAEEHCK